MTDDNHEYEHTYRVPVTGHGNITVAADTPEEAQEIAPGYVKTGGDLSVDSDSIHLEDVIESEDGRPMSEARNVDDSPASVDIPTVPTGRAFHRSRVGLGLTQAEVAERLGVGRTTVTGWENHGQMTLEQASSYAGVLLTERRRQYDG